MPEWRVPVTITQAEDGTQLSPKDVWNLAMSLPGGGPSGSGGDGYEVGPRKFTQTVEVEADDAAAAEYAARDLVRESIDTDSYPGWDVSSVGEAKET